jgi:hypothetical protein
MEVLSPHIYGFPAAPEASPLTIVPQLDALVREYNDGQSIPIAITESGYPTHTNGGVSELDQADYLVRGEQIAIAGGADRFYWYDFLNDGTNVAEQEQNFGLVRRPFGGVTYSPKPALVTQAVLIRQLAGLSMAENELSGSAYSVRWEAAGKEPVRVMWATEPATVNVSTWDPVVVTDAYGREVTLTPRAGAVSIALTGHPVYLRGDVRSVSVVEQPAISLSVPDRVAVGSPIPITVTVDRTHPVSASTWTTLRIGDQEHRFSTPPGQVTEHTITVPASAAAGVRSIAGVVGTDDDDFAWVSVDTTVVQPVEVAVAPVVAAGDPLTTQLAITVTNNRPDAEFPVATIDWRLGPRSGTVTDVATVPAAASGQTVIDVPAALPWVSYPYSVTVTGGDGAATSVSGTTGFGPIEPAGGDAVESIDIVELGFADFPRQPWNGPADLSGTVKLTHTPSALVVTAEITDDVHSNVQPSSASWNGDAIQLAVTPTLPGRSVDRTEHTVALVADGPVVYIHDQAPGGAIGESPGATASITRSGTVTSYVVTIPWAELGFAGQPAEAFGLSFVVADDDTGAGRGGWYEWGGGIARSKNPALLRPVQLIQ